MHRAKREFKKIRMFWGLCRHGKPDSKKRMVERAVAGHKGQNLRGKCAERVGTGRGVQREVF